MNNKLLKKITTLVLLLIMIPITLSGCKKNIEKPTNVNVKITSLDLKNNSIRVKPIGEDAEKIISDPTIVNLEKADLKNINKMEELKIGDYLVLSLIDIKDSYPVIANALSLKVDNDNREVELLDPEYDDTDTLEIDHKEKDEVVNSQEKDNKNTTSKKKNPIEKHFEFNESDKGTIDTIDTPFEYTNILVNVLEQIPGTNSFKVCLCEDLTDEEFIVNITPNTKFLTKNPEKGMQVGYSYSVFINESQEDISTMNPIAIADLKTGWAYDLGHYDDNFVNKTGNLKLEINEDFTVLNNFESFDEARNKLLLVSYKESNIVDGKLIIKAGEIEIVK